MDLYALLGVARTASDADIERAYRRLARRYHPGINPGDRVAEQAFARIQAAYQILADAERRREYDRGGRPEPSPELTVAFEGFDFSAPAQGPRAATFSFWVGDAIRWTVRHCWRRTSKSPASLPGSRRVAGGAPVRLGRRRATGSRVVSSSTRMSLAQGANSGNSRGSYGVSRSARRWLRVTSRRSRTWVPSRARRGRRRGARTSRSASRSLRP